MLVEHWWFHGAEGQSRLNTRLLAEVVRHPDFAELHTSAPAAWPPRELRLEPPDGPQPVARLAS